MRKLFLLSLALALAGACRDRGPAAALDPNANPTPHVSRVTTLPPALATDPVVQAHAPVIEGLEALPEAAQQRLRDIAAAVSGNASTVFLDAVWTGGFTSGGSALDRALVEVELTGVSVAELVRLPCADGSCTWRVRAATERELQLEARREGAVIGALRFVREDDASWGVAAADVTAVAASR